jgi:hypothetical protein
MRTAPLLLLTAALMVGSALASSGLVLDRSERDNRSTSETAAGAEAHTTRIKTVLRLPPEQQVNRTGFQSAALRESDFTRFIGHSDNGAGATVATFYDELSQTVFSLDSESADARVKNLTQQRLSADESELAMKTWPTRSTFGF